MKRLVILSGKGGTGKTSVAAAFAHLAHEGPSPLEAVLADADVDAANLELVLQPHRLEEHDFLGGTVAVIDGSLCQGCGACQVVCRFDAVLPPSSEGGAAYQVDPIACEGCAACLYECVPQAIRMEAQLAGRWFRSESRFGALFHAELYPAQENTGKLVTLVKQQARLLALDTGAQVVIIDGPPGIGCPAISAASGADLALIVTEPTVAGIHDMQRALQTTAHFGLATLVCINKADLYPPGTAQIEAYGRQCGIEVVGRIPFDPAVTESMLNGEPVTIYRPGSAASRAMVELWERVASRLNGGGDGR
jgi:MinD superfamily P-loop ATPase